MATTSEARSQSSDAFAARMRELFPTLAAGAGTVERLARLCTRRNVPAGTTMFSPHSPCSGFPLVLAGTVRVVQRYPNGRELQLYRVKPGESCLLSGGCLLSDAEYDATGIAETDVDLATVPAAEFHRLMADDAAFRKHVLANFGERLAAMMQIVEAVAYQKLDQRLAAMLLARAGPDGELRVTHQVLADALGSVREMVTRLLRSFEDRGWVELGRERIRIADRAALARVAAVQ